MQVNKVLQSRMPNCPSASTQETCERRVAELHDEKLFRQPPSEEDCPICFLRLPWLGSGFVYMSCCGKVICRGCVHGFRSRAAKAGRSKEDDVCPFCRTPPIYVNEKFIKRYEKRMDLNDAMAIYCIGNFYVQGHYGLPQNTAKALELWHRAGTLGCVHAYYKIGYAYRNGEGVEVDEKKATYYFELAAMRGNPYARHSLGDYEGRARNYNRALKHWIIAVKGGNLRSLKAVKVLYKYGHATKDNYAEALRSYQEYIDEIKSDQRDEAAALNDEYKYYESAV